MSVRTLIMQSFYQDSVVLMRLASLVRSRPGVREAAAFMGTPANHEILAQTGLATAETCTAQPNDLILAVDAATDAAAKAALADGEIPADRGRTAEIQVHCDGPNLGSAGGPTLQPLGAISRLRYEGLLAQTFRASGGEVRDSRA